MTRRDLPKLAEGIARDMKNRNMQPWHIKNELHSRAVPPMYWGQLATMIAEQLEQL